MCFANFFLFSLHSAPNFSIFYLVRKIPPNDSAHKEMTDTLFICGTLDVFFCFGIPQDQFVLVAFDFSLPKSHKNHD